ncbi:hypothetical protein BD626DRAFT_408793 [Schizophyllum amplum]|uniref:Glucose-methanol-choline oxidoreductase N-terminal domain-containing protein n=1 Tax=Schizophyllum amplum TaxID=97359 RepID=A0A550C4A3_9AGAR|nr:hypothetical protein BD626DRAFT_408793 [Auriculariopsis ampla]
MRYNIIVLSSLLASVSAVTISDGAAFASSSFDYIVIGAGTAGLPLAVRLSEDPSVRVGVIDAGETAKNVDIIDVPSMVGADLGTIYDWNYTTEAQGDIASVSWPRGKVVGGSSALNFLVWDLPSSPDFDAFERVGNPGWNWDSISAHVKKGSNFTTATPDQAAELSIQPNASDYGTDGPIHVSYGGYVGRLAPLWVAALEAVGIPPNERPNGGAVVGGGLTPTNLLLDNMTRNYAAPAYYYPNEARENLVLLTGALVSRVNFQAGCDEDELVAESVTYYSEGQVYNATVTKEVILSAGSINTPHILELSGIGQEDVLSAVGIDQLVDLPGVGENLQDHAMVIIAYEITNDTVTLGDLATNSTLAAEQLALWHSGQPSMDSNGIYNIGYANLIQLFGQEGAANVSAEAAAYAASQNSSMYANLTNVELDLFNDEKVGLVEFILEESLVGLTPEAGKAYMTIMIAHQHPFSRGSIHVNSSDPATYPLIRPNYLDVDLDVNVLVAGVEKAMQVATSGGYADMIKERLLPADDDEDLREYVRKHVTTEYHPVGTASMLPREQGGVVDCELRVYGTANVRVVDASVIPVHVSAHLQATVTGIAEVAADLIKASA